MVEEGACAESGFGLAFWVVEVVEWWVWWDLVGKGKLLSGLSGLGIWEG